MFPKDKNRGGVVASVGFGWAAVMERITSEESLSNKI